MQTNLTNTIPTSYTIYDMTEEQINTLENKLRPGNCSTEGFIAQDDDLREIYKNDFEYLTSCGISCEQIANTLRGLVRKAKLIQDYSHEVILGNKLKIAGTSIQTNGYQDCPFPTTDGKDCFHGRGDYIVTDITTGESFSFSGLAIHLIEAHGFFEGNTPYRIDLGKIIRILNLSAEIYKPILSNEWKFETFGDDNVALERHEKRLKKHAKQIEIVDEFAVAYIGVPFAYYRAYKYSGLSENEIKAIELKKKGFSDEEIKNKIEEENNRLKKWGFNINRDKKHIHPEGQEYMHLVNKKTRINRNAFDIFSQPTWEPFIAGIQIKAAISSVGLGVYKLNQFTYADINCD